jgi:hypothetical protein
MNSFEEQIPIDKLRRLVSLDEESGKLFWRKRLESDFVGKNTSRACNTWNARFSGKEAFCHMSGNGYLHGALKYQKVCAHRVVFALFNGHWPTNTIDHINGVRTDNRPSNLRDVQHIENMRNQPISKASSTGVTGVSFDKARNKYEAHITVCGKKKTLGRFDRVADAKSAREKANQEIGFHENHGRK